MKLWSRIKVRHCVQAELHRRISLQEARLAACQRELDKIGDMKYRAYGVTWVQMLDYYQELLLLQRNLHGCNLFWIVTGKRWLFRDFLARWARLTVRYLGLFAGERS